jgi:hypothetical protein
MRIALLVALAAAVTVARAQEPDTTAMKQPMDPENPIAFILLHRSQLRLADSQVTQLGNIGALLTMKMRPLKDSLDDLKPSDRPRTLPTTPMTPADRDSLFANRRAYARVLGEVHDAGRGARESAIAILNPDQQKKLQSLTDELALESRLNKNRPAISQQSGPPGASASGVGGRPY